MNAFRSIGLLALSLVLLFPMTARAELHKGFYLSGMAVMPFEKDGESDISGATKSDIEYMTGWGMSGAGGYAWGNGARAEVELVYRNNDIKEVKPSVLGDGGSIHNWALMGNVFYDMDLNKRLTPYVGFGLGAAHVDADNMRHMAVNDVLDDQQYAFAYQFIAGFNFDLEGPWSFNADYRYFATTNLEFETSSGVKADTDNASHNIMMGIRYDFAPPEAAPTELALAPIPLPSYVEAPPAMTPQMPTLSDPIDMVVPQSYIVFFDFDKSFLTAQARRIIASAAADYKAGKYVRVVVTAHTDTSGSKVYNQRLSERRARAVSREFGVLGVSVTKVATSALGETKLMIPTMDGMREAQNRRAEIVLD